LKGTDTVWQEHTKIKSQSNKLIYKVSDKINGVTTLFTITSTTDTSFITENPKNEFPKKIAYSKNGNSLNAVISGGGPDILFEYIKNN
jgi:hypothetical protein